MSDTSKKVYFVTGGGTGGHIYPALAVAQALKDSENVEKVYYVGNPNNLEYDIVTKAGFDFLPIKVSGMPRKIGFGFIKWLFELNRATWKALFYVIKYKPNAVIGTGGYVSAPALFAATLTKTPYMIHDCDAQPGIVSKVTAPCARLVSLAFESSIKYIKNQNFRVNGNPIRSVFKTLSKEQARVNLGLENKLTICIMGGSQGAKTINLAAVHILEKLLQKNVQIIFQTGSKKFEDVQEILEKEFPKYKEEKNLIVKPYFEDMVTILKASDIAVSRAGSLSLSEICASSIAPILIPYPYAAADHQRKNAKFMVEKGAALYLEDDETTSESLYDIINSLIENSEKILLMQENTKKLAKLDSTIEIVNQLKSIAK